MASKVQARVAGALTNVRNPRVDNDVISAGMIQDLEISDDGVVSFTFQLSAEDPASLVREAKKAVRAVEGVTDVKIRIVEPREAKSTRQSSAPPPPPQPAVNENLGNVVAVSSGKGGVGKSTVSANLAVALAAEGLAVGLMDADIYGPNLPRMLGVSQQPAISADRKIVPLEARGVKAISLGLMIERDAPAIWRGPIIMKIIQQFLGDVDWGELDFLIVDLPPGTGDAQLSLVQSIKVDGAIIVTTPQEMAVGDALRGAKMFEKVGVPVIGVVENMSGFTTPDGQHYEIFGRGGGERLAEEIGTPLLGQVPLQMGMTAEADRGNLVVADEPDSPAGQALRTISQEVKNRMGGKKISLPVIT